MHSCLCCLQCPPDKNLTTPYTHHDRTEIYTNMLKDCFNIQMELDGWGSYGICSLCAGRLRDASDFKLQVQRCQAELRARSQAKTSVKDELFASGVAAGDGASDDEESVFQQLPVKQEPATVYETELLEELPVKQEPATVYETELLEELPVKQEPATVDETELLDSERPVKSEVPDGAARAVDGPARSNDSCLFQSHRCASARSPPRRRARSQPAAACVGREYTCDMCTRQFKSNSTLSRHIRTHSRCQVCNKNSCLSRHEPNCSGNKQKKRKLTETRTLTISHDEEVLYTCEECGKGFRTKSVLRKHIQRNHNGEKLLYTSSHSSLYRHPEHQTQMSCIDHKPLHCSQCAYRTSDKSNLRRHQLKHTGDKPFKCTFCEFKCRDKSTLQTHQRIHTGEKPFKCSYCDFKCNQKSTLQTHLRIHTGEKPFKCSYCDFKCIQSAVLRRHQLIHTGEKPYKCSYCDFKCRLKSGVKSHQRIHNREKPIEFGNCD